MRVKLKKNQYDDKFSLQLLKIGNGDVPIDIISGRISFPQDFCNYTKSREELVTKVFPNIFNNYNNRNWLGERAILAPRNKEVYAINNIIMSTIPTEPVTYKSIHTVVEEEEAVNYPTKFNSLDMPGLPPHVLTLKVGVPIIMLRNINPPQLCNGTRMTVKKLMTNVVEATILTGPFKE
jgi:hypothetical protein